MSGFLSSGTSLWLPRMQLEIGSISRRYHCALATAQAYCHCLKCHQIHIASRAVPGTEARSGLFPYRPGVATLSGDASDDGRLLAWAREWLGVKEAISRNKIQVESFSWAFLSAFLLLDKLLVDEVIPASRKGRHLPALPGRPSLLFTSHWRSQGFMWDQFDNLIILVEFEIELKLMSYAAFELLGEKVVVALVLRGIGFRNKDVWNSCIHAVDWQTLVLYFP